MSNRNTDRDRVRRAATLGLAPLLGAGVLLMGGCQGAGQGAASGAAIGALAGFGLGSLGADAGAGAAAGAITGAIIGGVLGDQNQRADDRARRHSYYYHQPYEPDRYYRPYRGGRRSHYDPCTTPIW